MKQATVLFAALALATACTVDGPYAPTGGSFAKGETQADTNPFLAAVNGCNQRYFGGGVAGAMAHDTQSLTEWGSCLDAALDLSATGAIGKALDLRLAAYNVLVQEEVFAADPSAIEISLEDGLARIKGFMELADAKCGALTADVAEGSEQSRARCRVVVREHMAHTLMTHLFGKHQALPTSSNPATKLCQDKYEEAMSDAPNQYEWFVASSELRGCLAGANQTRLEGPLAERITRIESQLAELQGAAGDLCSLAVAVSDSPDGSIARLYRAGCVADTELFTSFAINFVMAEEMAAARAANACQ